MGLMGNKVALFLRRCEVSTHVVLLTGQGEV